MNKKAGDPVYYHVIQVEKRLPKGYRLRTYLADLEGPAELVIQFLDRTFLQCRFEERGLILGIIPYRRREWINIGEAPPSMLGLTTLPVIAIYKKFKTHAPIIAEALKTSQFTVRIEGEESD